MYIPAHFREDDRETLLTLMRDSPFATLITSGDTGPFATHLPLLLAVQGEELLLQGHVARANPQWTHFERGEALAIFHGPHALVHSGWYESSPNVPTWNYAVVHASGPVTLLTGEEVALEVARRLTATFTPDAPPIPAAYERKLLGGVVTFELRVRDLRGKFKLSQNKSALDRANVAGALARSDREEERRTAELMK